MSFDKLRKIVVIKNIPSDYIEEAIFILRIDENAEDSLLKKGSTISKKTKIESDYLIKEAQNIINNYIKDYEQKEGKLKPSIVKESGSIRTKKNLQKKFSPNSFIFITLIGSIIAFIYLLIRIVTY